MGIKMIKRILIFTFFFLLFFSFSGSAGDEKKHLKITKRMQNVVKRHTAHLLGWANSPLIYNFLIEQNNKNISLETIKAIDREWIAGNQNELAISLQENKIGKYLKEKVLSSPLIVEAFLCDKRGAVIALFPKTTDYWQGDEDKFIKSYGNGNGRIYLGPLSFDKSTNTYSVQISVPVNDWNDTIGVLVVGLKNIEENDDAK